MSTDKSKDRRFSRRRGKKASSSEQLPEASRQPAGAILDYIHPNTVTAEEPGDDGGATAATIGAQPAGGTEPRPARNVVKADDASFSGAPGDRSQERGWAKPGAAIHSSESAALAIHLDAQPTLTRPIAAEAGRPDLAAARARIEQELGIPEIEASLDHYGTPPVAPPAKRIDREALERDMLGRADGISRWNLRVRRSLRSQLRKQAGRQAEAEDERLAAEQRQLQAHLDNRWTELRALRHRASREAEEWVEKEVARREAARAQQQAILDREWQQLRKADSDSVTASLRATLLDEAITPVGFLEGVAVLLVTCPGREDLIAETEPAFIGDRHRAVRARSETRRNDLYMAAVASRILAAVARALSTAPAVEAVTGVAARACESGPRRWEPIYVGTFERAYAERVLAQGRWSSDPDVLTEVIEGADEVELEINGITHEIAALDISQDPGLASLIDQLDPAIRADDNAARRSGQEAVKTFLGHADTEGDSDIAIGQQPPADLRRDNDTAAHTPGETSAQRREEMAAPEPADVQAPEPAEMATPEPAGMAEPESPAITAPEPSDVAAYAPPGEKSEREAREEGVWEPSPVARLAPEQPMGSDLTDGFATGPSVSSPTSDPLTVALEDTDGSVRRAAVEAIGRRNDPNDTPLLLQALSDHDEIVRLEAMYALKERLSPELRRDALIKASGDSDEIVRRKAIEALADLADERDTPVLLEALKDRDDRVRLEAIYAVKHRLTPDMRDALIDACGDADEDIRRKAVEALAELGDERDTPLLLKALRDPDSNVRLEAIYALEGRSELGPSSRLSEPLAEAMKADDAIVRQAAVRLFGRLQGPSTATPPT